MPWAVLGSFPNKGGVFNQHQNIGLKDWARDETCPALRISYPAESEGAPSHLSQSLAESVEP